MALDYYLKKFKEIYPTGPKVSEVYNSYQTALSGIPDFLVDVACEEALKQCHYFPTPAEILELVPEQDKYKGTTSFDISADFVPVKDWYEHFSNTHNVHVWADKYGRQKVKIILKDMEHKLIGWPQHWNVEKTKPITWEEAKKKIGAIAQKKSL